MGVPQFKELRRAYGFDEVTIAPGLVTINPEMTNTDFSVDGITLSTPILGSAMDAVASPKFASTMDGLGGMAVMNLEGVQTRYNNPDDMLDEIVEASEESVTGILQKVYSAPIREELVGERVQEIKNSGAKCAVSVPPASTKRLAPIAVDAGADVLVAGSATFKGGPERYAANIAALKGQCTILIIGHRGALTGMADRIVTLRGGRIAEQTDPHPSRS